MDTTFELIYSELKQSTGAADANCHVVAERLTDEVHRVCTESDRIQCSGQVEEWAHALAKHRLQQCLKYYRLGSRQGRVELHGTLSALIYRHIAGSKGPTSYQGRLNLIEDFLQGFYIETLNALRRETGLASDYQPKTLLELSEYMAFSERYAKRRILLSRRRSQQLIILRAQTFSQQQPQETIVDMEQAAAGAPEENDLRISASLQQVREKMMAREVDPGEGVLRQKVVQELVEYLEQRGQKDCADYFVLRLKDLSAGEIEGVLGLDARKRDYLQQRFKYHLIRFAMTHHWELVHQWLEADLENNLGLLPQQWQIFRNRLDDKQVELLDLKQTNLNDAAIAKSLGWTLSQLQRQWSKLLQRAWEMRNVGAATETRAKVSKAD